MGRILIPLLLLLMVVGVAIAANETPRIVRCKELYSACYNRDLYCPSTCPRTCKADCYSCKPLCDASSPPPPPTTYPPSPSPSPTPTPTPPPLPTTYPPPTTPQLPPAYTVAPAPGPLPSWWSTAACMNPNYPFCYRTRHNCPGGCPDECLVDCVTCSPICDCSRPGAVCQDPKFVGADGLTFYFHGKKDHDFCIVSDPNLHINAHFIGKQNQNKTRDFTWVQSLGILFDTHKLIIGAKKTTIWDNAIDRLYISFNQEHLELPVGNGAIWRPKSTSGVSVTRTHETNRVVIEVEGNFKIKARVVPITERESKVHNYGITDEDRFAHLDLSFKFHSLSDQVSGVLGQTYAKTYVSRVKMGVEMSVLGGEKDFASSSLISTDCGVSRFNHHVLSVVKSE